jgi:5'-methylthioadenosine phosphorylase
VTIEMIISNLRKNIDNAKKILRGAIKSLPAERDCNCSSALKFAIMTDRKVIPAKIKKDLKIIIGKYIK